MDRQTADETYRPSCNCYPGAECFFLWRDLLFHERRLSPEEAKGASDISGNPWFRESRLFAILSRHQKAPGSMQYLPPNSDGQLEKSKRLS